MANPRVVSTPKRGVVRQAVYLAFATALAQVVIAIVYLFAARGSRPGEFGLAVAAIALGTTAVGFVDFGTNSHWAREVARGTLKSRELVQRSLSKVAVAVIAGLIWSAVAAIYFPATGLWAAGPVLVSLLSNQTAQVALRGTARNEMVAVSLLVDRGVVAVTFFGLLLCGQRSVNVLWIAIVCGSAAAAATGLIASGVLSRASIMGLVRWVNPWRGAGYFGLTQLAQSAQTLDLPLLTLVGGPVAAGLYGSVSRWTQPMSLLASAFASASAPFVARSKHIVDAWQHLRKGIWMPCCAIVLALMVFILAPQIVSILLGDSYEGSSAVLRVLALLTIPSIVSQPLFIALQSSGRDRYVAWVSIGATIAQLGLVALLGQVLGAIGAAVASLVAQCGILVAFSAGIWVQVRQIREAEDRSSADPA